MKHFADISTLVIVTLLFAAVTLLNIFQTDRPTVSESENRDLAAFPTLSADSLADGSYFTDISLFVSDTFVERDALLSLAKRIKLLYGLNNNDVSFIPVAATEDKEIEVVIPDVSDRPAELTTDAATLPAEEEIIVIGETTEANTGAETEVSIETDAETEVITETEPVTEAETEPQIDSLTLSSSDIYISIGASKDLYAYVQPSDNPDLRITWRNSNSNVAKLAAVTDHLSVTGVSVGTTVITASVGSVSVECTVHVTVAIEPVETGNSSQIITEEPEILTSGMVIYKDAVYSIPYFVQRNAEYFAQTIEYYAALFKNSKISVCVAPLSSATLELDTFGRGRLTDQNDIINKVFALMDDSINKVNPFDAIWEHRDEYLYFKSDHHWTARGAYYAYAEFAKSVGFEPVSIDDMEERLLTDSFQGTMYAFTGDERVKSIYDSVYAYIPTKQHTMTIYSGGGSTVYDSSILTSARSYGAFIGGDYAYTIINVPDNPQNVNILVLKDSYGNAFIPYLCEHYGNIIVVDPRHVTFDIYELLKDYPLRDVLSMTNIYNPNVASWSLNLLRAVGAN